MKKIIYGFILCLTAGTFVGCDDYNNPNEGRFEPDTQSGWVQFDVATTTVLSGATTEFSVPVALHAPVNTDGLTVTYTVTDMTGSTAGVVTYTGEATVPEGSLTGDIMFTLSETPLTSCVEYMITITGTSRSNVQVGLGEGERPTTHIVRIVNRENLLGTYDVVEGGDTYEATVEAGEASNEIIVRGLFGTGDDTETHLFLNATGGTVSFPAYTENFLFTDAEVGDVSVGNDYEGLLNEPNRVSTFNSCGTPTIELNYLLIFNADGALNAQHVNAVMTKQ